MKTNYIVCFKTLKIIEFAKLIYSCVTITIDNIFHLVKYSETEIVINIGHTLIKTMLSLTASAAADVSFSFGHNNNSIFL